MLGFLAPPPHIQISSMRSANGENVRYCFTMFWPVICVSVATVSYLLIPWARHSSISCCASASPNTSRPVVLGGLRLQYSFSARKLSTTAWLTVPRAPHSPSLSLFHFAIREEPHRRIDEHVAWSAVPVDHRIYSALVVRRYKAEVGYAADILAHPHLSWVAQ